MVARPYAIISGARADPADGPKADDAKGNAGGEKNLFGGLALRRAKASGHVVWLQMPSQNAKIRCIELIHT